MLACRIADDEAKSVYVHFVAQRKDHPYPIPEVGPDGEGLARQQELERQLLEAQRQAADMLARRQAAESENDARQRAARDAQTIQALENERLNARRQQEQEALRQQLQQAQQEALRRQQQQYDEQRRRAQQGN